MEQKFQLGTMVFDHWCIDQQISTSEFGDVFVLQHQDSNIDSKSQLKVVSVPKNLKDLMLLQHNMPDVGQYIQSVVSFVMEEVELMTKLNGNPHVVQYYDHLKQAHENGIGFDILLRTEHLMPLEDYVMANPLTRSDILRLGIQICLALEECHHKDIIHRDIQLKHLYATDSGNFKLGNFAIPCIEASDLPSLGNDDPQFYMAPELCKGEDYDHTVDIYALTMILHQLLNKNRLAFVPESRVWVTKEVLEEARAMRLAGEPLPPPYFAKKGKLCKVLHRGTQHNAKDRYQSALALRRDLEAVMPKKEDGIPLYPSVSPFHPKRFGKQSVLGTIFGFGAEGFGIF